jgi:hypothetical protein
MSICLRRREFMAALDGAAAWVARKAAFRAAGSGSVRSQWEDVIYSA